MALRLNKDGTIHHIRIGQECITFREDEYSGIRIYVDYGDVKKQAILEQVEGTEDKFEGKLDQLKITLTYTHTEEEVVATIEVENLSPIHFKPVKLGVHLGIDSYMEKYPEWNENLFPTLMRCEKTHFWGYMMAPSGRILVVGIEEPVASWSLEYNELPPNRRENIYMKGGHRIYTANLDLINRGPLPTRHPLLDELLPKEKKVWTVHMKVLEQLEQVPPILGEMCKAPMIQLGQYTVEEGESVEGVIYSQVPLKKVYRVRNDRPMDASQGGRDSGISQLKKDEKISQDHKEEVIQVTGANGIYKFSYPASGSYGLSIIKVINENGKEAEASFYIKKPWSWYLKKAREEVVDKPPAYSHHIESFNSFFTIFLARKHFPDTVLDVICEQHFQTMFDKLYDYEGKCVKEGKHRVQDTAGLAAAMGIRYTVTQDKEDLKIAGYLADSLMEKQKEDGAYYSGNTHYTSVTYLAKYMLELAFIEGDIGKEDLYFEMQSKKHFDSAIKAIKNLIKQQDNIETEGEMTFEDGMISCSLTQIALYGLITKDEEERQQCIQVAEELYSKHRCLTQLMIPDARMHGATLRFWEAQYNVNLFSNMMNSPCGWTAWKIYGDWYLYLLTYNTQYLKEAMDTLGACMQLVDCQTGKLRWGFITDPYIETKQYVQGDNHKGKIIDTIIGEQYVEMISGWHKEEQFPRYNKFGIDHLVHEIFKALEEVALKICYIWEDEDSQLKTYNCQVTQTQDVLHIIPAERIIDRLHVNFKEVKKLHITFAKGDVKTMKDKGFVK